MTKIAAAALVVILYWIAVLSFESKIEEDEFWCRGKGLFYILTAITCTGLFYFKVLKPLYRKWPYESQWLNNRRCQFFVRNFNLSLIALLLGCQLAYLLYDSFDQLNRLRPLAGIFIFIFLGTIFSAAPGKIIWRQILWGIFLQFCLAILVIKWAPGRTFFECLLSKISAFFDNADKGADYVFEETTSKYSVIGLKIAGYILFFNSIISVLLFYGILQWIIFKVAWLLQISVGTGVFESVNAVASIFLSMDQSPMLVKPFLDGMTRSELHSIMTGGFATMSGTILAIYVSFGIDGLHLITASIMSAPAALAFSKLVYPEIQENRISKQNIEIQKGKEANGLHAAIVGLAEGIKIVAGILVCVLGFVSFVHFIDAIFNWGCLLLDYEDGVCSLSGIIGVLFMPLALLMGVPWEDCFQVGQLIGTKIILNEFIGYIQLAKAIKANLIKKRSEIIATYALCGFSNLGGIGVLLGSIGAMAPRRKPDLARMAFSAMLAGNAACFLTACVAGTLIPLEEAIDQVLASNVSAT